MANVTARIEGISELQAQIFATGDFKTLGPKLRSRLRKVAVEIQKNAQQTAPRGERSHLLSSNKQRVYPGYLRQHIVAKSGIGKTGRYAWAKVGPTALAFYGTSFVEIGTSRTPAQPWLEPAVRLQGSKLSTELADVMRERIERIANMRALPAYVPGSITPRGLDLSRVPSERRNYSYYRRRI